MKLFKKTKKTETNPASLRRQKSQSKRSEARKEPSLSDLPSEHLSFEDEGSDVVQDNRYLPAQYPMSSSLLSYHLFCAIEEIMQVKNVLELGSPVSEGEKNDLVLMVVTIVKKVIARELAAGRLKVCTPSSDRLSKS